MVEKHDRIWAIYPEYFDSGVPRGRGRRIPKDLAVHTPTLDELFHCAGKLDLTPVKEPEVAYPAFWWRTRGRLLVRKEWSKTETLRRLAAELDEHRRVHGSPGDRDDTRLEPAKRSVPRPHPGQKPAPRSWKDRKKGSKGKKGKKGKR